ncbi:MAG: RNA polymerase sigma factor [Candidatus Korobacteraceae bacterium]
MSAPTPRLREVSLEETLEPNGEDCQPKEIAAADQNLSGSIDRVILERAIENLPLGYRSIFVLHDIEGYEHGDIAEMLGCAMGNSKSQLHKARMKLREVLSVTGAENSRRPAPRKMTTQREVTVATGRRSRAADNAA